MDTVCCFRWISWVKKVLNEFPVSHSGMGMVSWIKPDSPDSQTFATANGSFLWLARRLYTGLQSGQLSMYMASIHKQEENSIRTKEFKYFAVIPLLSAHSHCPAGFSLRSLLEIVLPLSLANKITEQCSAQVSYNCKIVFVCYLASLLSIYTKANCQPRVNTSWTVNKQSSHVSSRVFPY